MKIGTLLGRVERCVICNKDKPIEDIVKRGLCVKCFMERNRK